MRTFIFSLKHIHNSTVDDNSGSHSFGNTQPKADRRIPSVGGLVGEGVGGRTDGGRGRADAFQPLRCLIYRDDVSLISGHTAV